MFSKLSRYYKVQNVAVADAQGQVLASKDLRLLPEVTGTFRHRVQAGDRLDQLSHKYYSQPVQWWHICDANPQFLSPLALLGDEVIVTTRFPLTVPGGGQPPWEALLRELEGVLAVEDVQVIEEVEIVSKETKIDNQIVSVFEERFHWEVLVTYNKLIFMVKPLADTIEGTGFSVGEPTEISQLGQEIVIPPKITG